MFINLPSDTGWVISFDTLGCKDSLQFIIHNPPPLNIIPFNDTVICIGSVLTYNMNISGGTQIQIHPILLLLGQYAAIKSFSINSSVHLFIIITL